MDDDIARVVKNCDRCQYTRSTPVLKKANTCTSLFKNSEKDFNLSTNTYSISYKAGKSLSNADALSRLPTTQTTECIFSSVINCFLV